MADPRSDHSEPSSATSTWASRVVGAVAIAALGYAAYAAFLAPAVAVVNVAAPQRSADALTAPAVSVEPPAASPPSTLPAAETAVRGTLVSVIVPAHNALRVLESGKTWLDEALESCAAQTHRPLQLSIFDDGSDDGTGDAIRAWARKLEEAGVDVVASGSRWNGHESAPAVGTGAARNRAVAQSSGEFLCFLDVDDVMFPTRVARQLAANRSHLNAIVGGGHVRSPPGSTAHYSNWANTLSQRELKLQQFRECTVLMPTWFMHRAVFDAVGGFPEVPAGSAEDLRFFLSHLLLGGDLFRVGDAATPVVSYRWSAGSGASKCTRRLMIDLRAKAFEERILDKAWTGQRFRIWGAGRDAKHFVRALTPHTRLRISAMIELNERICGRDYVTPAGVNPREKGNVARIPIVHFESAESAASAGDPVVCCVSLRRAHDQAGDRTSLRTNISAACPGLEEGETLWYFC